MPLDRRRRTWELRRHEFGAQPQCDVARCVWVRTLIGTCRSGDGRLYDVTQVTWTLPGRLGCCASECRACKLTGSQEWGTALHVHVYQDWQVLSSSWDGRPFGRKVGAALLPFWELGPHLTQYHLGRGLHPYQLASWSMQPFGHNRHGPKIGSVPLLGGAGSPSNTMWPGLRPTSIPSFTLIHRLILSDRCLSVCLSCPVCL